MNHMPSLKVLIKDLLPQEGQWRLIFQEQIWEKKMVKYVGKSVFQQEK